MQITLEIPDDLAVHLLPSSEDPARSAVELLAAEGYRNQRLTEHQIRIMLGYETRMEFHTFWPNTMCPFTTH